MRIGIEANALRNEAGTGVLVRHLIRELRARDHEVIEFRHNLSSKGSSRPSSARRWMNGLRQALWTQVTLPLAAARRRVDVLLCPAYVGPLLSPAPVVLMVLDLTFLVEPQTGLTGPGDPDNVVAELLGIRLGHGEHPSSPTHRARQVSCHLFVQQTRGLPRPAG